MGFHLNMLNYTVCLGIVRSMRIEMSTVVKQVQKQERFLSLTLISFQSLEPDTPDHN